MNAETLTGLVNLGSAGAVIMTVSLFLLHLRKCQIADRAEREAERAALTDIIKNDLGHVTEGLVKVNDGLTRVVQELRERKGD
jgi:hypothetical protein